MGHSDNVHIAAGVRLHLGLLLLHHPVDAAYLIAQGGGALKLQLLRSLLHLMPQLPGNPVRVAFHKHDDLLDYLGIVFPAGQTGAGGHAAVNIILQAGAGVMTGDNLGTRTVGKQFLDQIHCLADAAGGSEGSEIAGAVLGHLPGDVNPGEILGKVNLQVGIGLVILEASIEVGLVSLNEGVFQDQGFRLSVGDDKLKIRQLGNHLTNLGRKAGRGAEVSPEPVAQNTGLANIQNLILGVSHNIDARLFRGNSEAVFKQGLGHLFNQPTSRITKEEEPSPGNLLPSEGNHEVNSRSPTARAFLIPDCRARPTVPRPDQPEQ